MPCRRHFRQLPNLSIPASMGPAVHQVSARLHSRAGSWLLQPALRDSDAVMAAAPGHGPADRRHPLELRDVMTSNRSTGLQPSGIPACAAETHRTRPFPVPPRQDSGHRHAGPARLSAQAGPQLHGTRTDGCTPFRPPCPGIDAVASTIRRICTEPGKNAWTGWVSARRLRLSWARWNRRVSAPF